MKMNKSLVDEYCALEEQIKKLNKRKAQVKSELLKVYHSRPSDDPNAKRLNGTANTITVVYQVRKTFDRKKYELKHGAFHDAYWKESVAENLVIGGLEG